MIHIDEFLLRIPHMELQESRALGKKIAEEISRRMPKVRTDKKLDNVNIRIPYREGMTNGELSRIISDQLIMQLKIATQ